MTTTSPRHFQPGHEFIAIDLGKESTRDRLAMQRKARRDYFKPGVDVPLQPWGHGATGGYRWRVGEVKRRGPHTGIGFYLVNGGTDTDDSSFRLRIEMANDHLRESRLSEINGYFYNDHGDTYKPIVARLPHGRGFLAGATMGEGMSSFLDGRIHDTIEEAARAAHREAEIAAEKQREYEEEENARLAAEEDEQE